MLRSFKTAIKRLLAALSAVSPRPNLRLMNDLEAQPARGVADCSCSFDEEAKRWRVECFVFLQEIETPAPPWRCPFCNFTFRVAAPPKLRLLR